MMIRGLSYDDRRLRDLPGEPLLATMVESAARCCGAHKVYMMRCRTSPVTIMP